MAMARNFNVLFKFFYLSMLHDSPSIVVEYQKSFTSFFSFFFFFLAATVPGQHKLRALIRTG